MYLTTLEGSWLGEFIKKDQISFLQKEVKELRKEIHKICNNNANSIITINNKYIETRGINNTTKIYKITDTDDIPEEEMCIICYNSTLKNEVLVPCGHTQFCNKCIKDITKCPLCRQAVTQIIKIYK